MWHELCLLDSRRVLLFCIVRRQSIRRFFKPEFLPLIVWRTTMKILATLSSFALFALSSMSALAAPGQVPEPGSFALLAIGAGAAAIVWARGRNKK
jgi:hypothetical protein